MIYPKTNESLSHSEKKILKLINESGPTHSNKLEQHLGTKRVRTYWGGFSKSTKLIIESLHDRGVLRVAHCENGMRMYESTDPFISSLSPRERLKKILFSALKSMGTNT